MKYCMGTSAHNVSGKWCKKKVSSIYILIIQVIYVSLATPPLLWWQAPSEHISTDSENENVG